MVCISQRFALAVMDERMVEGTRWVACRAAQEATIGGRTAVCTVEVGRRRTVLVANAVDIS